MKKYLLLGSINGIGGWQLYLDARASHLADSGYEVYILYATAEKVYGPIKLKALKRAKTVFCGEVMFQNPNLLGRKYAMTVVEYVRAAIDYQMDDQVFVESTSMPFSLWGELLAKELHGVNFTYLLHSHIENVAPPLLKYFAFKYRQGLLAGMSKKTLPDLFRGYITIDDGKECAIAASWKSPLCDCAECRELFDRLCVDLPNDDDVIGYFGTLNKPHFREVCRIIRRFADENQERNVLFLSIGSSFDHCAEQYQKDLAAGSRNLKCINIPELYPVPQQLFQRMDVCIGSWGSSIVAARGGALTIRLENDVVATPQGIIGITLKHFPYYTEDSCGESLLAILEKAIVRGVYNGIEMVAPPAAVDYHLLQRTEDEVIRPFDCSGQRQVYYDVFSIPPHTQKEKVKYWGYKLLGCTAMEALLRGKRRCAEVITRIKQ